MGNGAKDYPVDGLCGMLNTQFSHSRLCGLSNTYFTVADGRSSPGLKNPVFKSPTQWVLLGFGFFVFFWTSRKK